MNTGTKEIRPGETATIPILLGVTGHRDLREEDRDTLKRALESVFHRFKTDYPNTPLVLMCSLAEGADQLAGETAIECGASLLAPLPFPPEVYLGSSSFQSESARSKFRELIKKPETRYFTVPPGHDIGSEDKEQWERLRDDETTRRQCYAHAGGYIARRCHALIALWDGQVSSKPGGTAHIVRFKLLGHPPYNDPEPPALFDWADSGPVYVIHTPRRGSATSRAAGELNVIWPGTDPSVADRITAAPLRHEQREAEQFCEVCRNIDVFNSQVSGTVAGSRRTADQVLEAQLGPGNAGCAPFAPLIAIARVREAAAEVSRRLAAWVDRLYVALFALIFFAVLCFHLYAHDFTLQKQFTWQNLTLLIAFLTLLLGSALVVFVVQWFHLEKRALDYRALAEALRVQFYWGVAGIGESVAANYLRQVRTEMSWVRRAVRAITPPPQTFAMSFAARSSGDRLKCLRAVAEMWVAGQQKFFKRRHHQYHVRHRVCRWGGTAVALAGWLCAFVLLARGCNDVAGTRDRLTGSNVAESPGHSYHLIVILSGACVVAGGLWIAYSERRLLAELSRQYERMEVLFNRGEQSLVNHLGRDDEASAQKVLHELGKEALTENAQWLILRRARPFELHIGG